ncbi:HD domain-containing protein [Pseudobutyrivibrio xylanivorans]|uniref:HD domain-containing protein n=1 Tax=Pseudobutyrivibrio xylanivorans TaxID=185007 RepID=A0A6M0LKQ0_PSEXY|nr:HD domain-containing protein [Pseudobutyrivibrio xylanivorans]
MQDEIIDRAIEYVSTLFKGNSDGHDVQHTLRVYKNVQLLLKSYPEADSFISLLSALLPDVDDHKLFKTENNFNARTFLKENGLSRELIDEICEVINSVSFSKNKGKTPRTLEGQIVQDADRLDAIGAIGIARTFAYGGRSGRSLDDSIQHFYDKLLLLKDEMNTGAAIKIAVMRHEYMENFLKEYNDENII